MSRAIRLRGRRARFQVLGDPTGLFRHGAEFRQDDFVMTLAGGCWPEGLQVWDRKLARVCWVEGTALVGDHGERLVAVDDPSGRYPRLLEGSG